MQGSSKSKQITKNRMSELLRDYPQGLSQSEIAEKLEVNRSTICKYLQETDDPEMLKYEISEDQKVRLRKEGWNFNISLTLDDAIEVYLAVRLYAARMNHKSDSGLGAIEKISKSLAATYPDISRAIDQTVQTVKIDAKASNEQYLDKFRTLTRAWAHKQKLRVSYKRNLREGKPTDFVLSVYCIEPYAIGQSVYVIGFAEREQADGSLLPDGKRTFKVDYLQKVEYMAHTNYTIPDDFDVDEYLKDAWGIWTDSHGQTEEVVLHFSKAVADRVKETRWHRSQVLEDQPDGSLIFRVRVAKKTEMEPWIRGWGDEVEEVKSD